MTLSGAYREVPHDPNLFRLRAMEIEIKRTGKRGLKLPEGIGEGFALPKFKEMIEGSDKKPTIDPEKIALYSVTTGILEHAQTDTITEKITHFHYISKNPSGVKLTIVVNENTGHAIIIGMSTADAKP